MLKKITLLLILLFVSGSVDATDYYVRVTSTGTTTTCNGQADVDYDGSGTGEACAYAHPAWAIGATGTSGVLTNGDRLLIGPGSYMIGYGMPNTSGCSSSSPYDCLLDTIPSGVKIYGSNYLSCDNTSRTSKPQLWGTQSVPYILNVDATSNVDIQCLDITDHSDCGFRVGGNQCDESYPITETYGRVGIYGFGGSNLNFKNLDVHGLSYYGLQIGGFNGYTRDYVRIAGNHFANVEGDRAGHANTSFSGTITITNSQNRYAGCTEAYPPNATFAHADYVDCTDQNASGYGDGEGTYQTGGNWVIKNSDWSWSTSDGLDLLYHTSGNVSIDKSRFEGNNGNSLKVVATNLDITNSVSISNCSYLYDNSKVFNTGTWSSCRANGGLTVTPMLGSVINLFNNTIVSATHTGGSAAVEVSGNTGAGVNTSTCNGTEDWNFSNNIYYSPNAAWTLYYNDLGGVAAGCTTALNSAVTDHSIIYNFQSNPCPGGTGNLCATNPIFVATPSASSNDNLTKIYLQSGSPARGAGTSGNSFWNTSTDYNSYPQNSPVDIGALQYGSTPSEPPASSPQTNVSTSGKVTITGGRFQ